ncbi:YitT family protein [Paenibacillus sp. NPDC056579]|uniref:YitT family protein n=1 Tax=unclassified Paenibacillus TaxID=185978 RepID=UPI0031F31C7E|nr:hypothetical protein DVH26_13855 [Paenibacillus sp. H1-7]
MIPLPRKIAAILIGSLLISIGINFYLIPFIVLDGGVIGIALIISYLYELKVGLVMILASIPIFLIAWFRYRALFYNSLHGMLVSSFFVDLLEPYQYHFLYYIELSPISSSIIGGLFIGSGIGIMLRYETSTGGTDLLAVFISRWIRVNVGVIIFVIDGIIISLGGLLLSAETMVLSLLTITAGGLATSLFTLHTRHS